MAQQSTILIVDDRQENRTALEALLCTEGHELIFAANGPEALNIVRNGASLDLILLDVMMPDMNGYEVCKAIRTSGRHAEIPIIMVTALDDRESRLRGLDAGADDFISSPVDKEELRTRIRTIARLDRYRKIVENAERADYLASYDPLTQLPNRREMLEVLENTLESARATGSGVAVYCVGLRQLAAIHDSLGHEFGAELLKEITARFKSLVRKTDMVARVSDDRFYIIQPMTLARTRNVTIISNRFINAFAEPFVIDDSTIYASANVGISTYPADSQNAETLVSNAAVAMTKARSRGPSSQRFFNREMNEKALHRLQMESDLLRAVENEEFRLHYQPIVCLLSGEILGVEALLRWQRQNGELVGPGTFIPIAEQSGLVERIGAWVMRTACHQARLWVDEFGPDFRVSVNVSPQQFRSPKFLEFVRSALQDATLPGNCLEIELTESLLMPSEASGRQRTVSLLKQLRAIGVHLSVDDFGTGYSSLAYLWRLPVDTLKIDRSFVGGLPGSKKSVAITRTVIELAQRLGLTTIAEGVENHDQLTQLVDWGCTAAQGYLFSKPAEADTVSNQLATGVFAD